MSTLPELFRNPLTERLDFMSGKSLSNPHVAGEMRLREYD